MDLRHHIRKAGSVVELSSKEFLVELFGNITHLERLPMKTPGFSGSSHERIIITTSETKPISLVLKRVSLSKDMTVWRTGNVPDREVKILESSELSELWDIIECPYVAYAIEGLESALLMRDLSHFLFPDLREPIKIEDEDTVLKTLACVHARFLNRDLAAESWLVSEKMFFDFLGPESAAEEKAAGREHPIFSAVETGWQLASQLMPADLRSFVLQPPLEEMTRGLPRTLIHGDAKLANFAILPGEKVSAFDWTVVGYATPAIELGWYLAVNASRLARPKEKVFLRYRELFELEFGEEIDNDTWERMIHIAVIAGARMLLWNKALNVQKTIAGAEEEWEWWLRQLLYCRSKYQGSTHQNLNRN